MAEKLTILECRIQQSDAGTNMFVRSPVLKRLFEVAGDNEATISDYNNWTLRTLFVPGGCRVNDSWLADSQLATGVTVRSDRPHSTHEVKRYLSQLESHIIAISQARLRSFTPSQVRELLSIAWDRFDPASTIGVGSTFYVDRIGVELEGAWNTAPPGLYPDSSIENLGSRDDCDCNRSCQIGDGCLEYIGCGDCCDGDCCDCTATCSTCDMGRYSSSHDNCDPDREFELREHECECNCVCRRPRSHHDLTCDCESSCDCDAVGEICSLPEKLAAGLAWVTKRIPDRVNRSCGLHCHISTYSLRDYSRLMDLSFYDRFMARMSAYGIARGYKNDGAFFSRLSGEGYNADRFAPDSQVRGDTDRYTLINFQALEKHGTLEFRLLPARTTAANAVADIAAVVGFVESYLWDANTASSHDLTVTLDVSQYLAPRREVIKLREVTADLELRILSAVGALSSPANADIAGFLPGSFDRDSSCLTSQVGREFNRGDD